MTPVSKLSLATYNTFHSDTLKFSTNIALENILYSYNDQSDLTQKQIEAITSFLSTASIDIETIYDSKLKKMQFNCKLNIDKNRSTSFSAYIDNDVLALYFDEINQEIIYIEWDRLSEILGTDISFQDYIDKLFSIDFTPLIDADVLAKIYNLLNDNLTFKIKNYVETKINKNKKTTEYELTTTLPEMKNLLNDFNSIILANETFKDSLLKVLNGSLDMLIADLSETNINYEILNNWVNNNDKFSEQTNMLIKNMKHLPNIKLYTYKNKLVKLSFSNLQETNLFDISFSYKANVTTIFYPTSSELKWLNISDRSINLGSFNSNELATFYKKFTRKLYVLSLKYPEFLELFAPLIIE
jgi:hypothetical protein